MVTPDTTYNHTTDIMGLSPFSVIAYIDSTTGITQPSPIDNTKVFVYDSKLNIEPPQEITNGEVSIYSINGQLVNTYDINKEKLTIPLDNLSNAPYIYLVETLLAVIKS